MSESNKALEQSKLIDAFGREIRYLRISVTDRCNLRCTYCMAEDMTFLPKSQVLSLEELYEVGRTFTQLGVEKIRLTGGEPLVRQGVVKLASKLAKLAGLRELVMTSNGVLLDKHAQALADAGMQRINISLDSLREDRFKTLTRFGKLNDVLRGIDSAVAAGFKKLKLNSVVLKGFNDDEVIDLTQFAIDKGMDISFIEEMPLGHIDSHSRVETALTTAAIKESLNKKFRLLAADQTDLAAGPSRYQKIEGTDTKVGFISPMSDNFCASCNRVRVTAQGQLLLCLGNEHSLDLKEILRNNPEALSEEIVASMQRKPERHHFNPQEITITRFMSATGG